MHVAGAREVADDGPVAVPEGDPRADAEPGELARRLPAHDHLAETPLEGPALDDPDLIAHVENGRPDAAEGDVVGLGLALAREVDHHHQLGRRERTARGVARHAREGPEENGGVPGHAARELGVRAGPEEDDPGGASGAGQRVAEALAGRQAARISRMATESSTAPTTLCRPPQRGHANTSIANGRRMRPAHVELRGRRRPWAPARPELLETGPGAATSEAARP